MEHLYWDLGSCVGVTSVEVQLRGVPARVCLMDVEEYQAYLDGDEYEYHGGYWESSPMVLDIPYDARWYLVVDGYDGRITVQVAKLVD